MDKRFWAILGVIIILFTGIVVFQSKKNTTNKENSANATNHIVGAVASKTVVTEYGDYQCPACEGYFLTVKAVQEKYKDTVKFQFRNLPLLQIHPNAFSAARAAEAADLQGKFWEMHDLLYTQTNWSEWTVAKDPVPYFKQYAVQLNLDAAKFQKDFASSVVNDRINSDIDAFKATGQPLATPNFFINGKNYPLSNFVDQSGQPSVDAFSKVLDAALKSSASQ